MTQGLKDELSIRDASAKDTEQVVDLIYSSAPELFEYMFTTPKKQAKDFIRYEYAQGGGFMGHRIHKVAESHQQVLGIGAFYTGWLYNRLNMQTVKNIISFYGVWASPKVLQRANHSNSIMQVPKKHELYIADLGVSEQSRGMGIGSALIQYHIDGAKENHLKTLSLDVATTNPRAEALYRRLGFNVIKEKQFKGGKGADKVPGARRMIYQVK